ncbi:MAG: helix-turn-helix transcriptional regulator [Faecalibacillus sp.]
MQRLLEILYYLMEVKQTTANELAQHFEVSIRTIYRDLDRLIVAGIPIHTKQGKNGGISIAKEYILDKSILNDHKQEQVLLALNTLSALQLPEFAELSKELEALFHKKSIDWIDIDFSYWHDSSIIQKKYDLIKNAIFNTQYLSFHYINLHNIQSVKTVEPMQLVFKSQTWYLKAFDISKEKLCIYRLSRMKDIYIIDKTFERRQLTPMSYFYQESYPYIHVILKFDLQLRTFVYDEFNENNIIEKDDSIYVHTKMMDSPWLISVILSFGSNVEIIEPIYLKKRLFEEIDKIKNKYDKPVIR